MLALLADFVTYQLYVYGVRKSLFHCVALVEFPSLRDSVRDVIDIYTIANDSKGNTHALGHVSTNGISHCPRW